tara:strand:- start:1693 stop:2004 length:312 start_codon:yes stop_codon:yes gene_type:complete
MTNDDTDEPELVSGVINVADLQTNPLEERVSISTWISTPASWPTIQVIKTSADNLGLIMTYDPPQESGWIFKRCAYSFKVEGPRSKMERFKQWYNSFLEANGI